MAATLSNEVKQRKSCFNRNGLLFNGDYRIWQIMIVEA